MANLLYLENIQKNFGSLEILQGVTMPVPEGTKIAILGPSGAGKSTLLHVAGLMERPTQGKVFFKGEDSSEFSEKETAAVRLNSIGFLFQFHYLLPDFNVLENTLIPARMAKDDIKKAEAEAKNILEKLGLSARLNHRPHQLSGGEQQRTALARALIRRPSLLLCDEPTGNLDSKTAKTMMDLLWAEVEERKLSIMLVTHNEELARKADISYHLTDGKLKTDNKGV